MPGPTKFAWTNFAGTVTALDMISTTGWVLGEGLVMGTSAIEHVTLHQDGWDGDYLTSSRRPNVMMQIPLIMREQTTVAAMKTLYDALVVELDKVTNTIAYRPQGAAADFLIDTYRADIPSIRQGEGMPSPFTIRGSRSPLILNIMRKPQLRGAGAYL
jgi:hypothetical protein